MAIQKIETIGSFFVGQGKIVLFDEAASLSTATLDSFSNPRDIGDVMMDSTNFTGDAPTTTPLLNEQGLPFYSTTQAGTFSFEFFVPSTSPLMLKTLMNGKEIAANAGTNGLGAGLTATGAMHNLPVIERPMMIVNEKLNKALLIPNARVTSSFGMQDRVSGINVQVLAQHIDTAALSTVVLLEGNIIGENGGTSGTSGASAVIEGASAKVSKA